MKMMGGGGGGGMPGRFIIRVTTGVDIADMSQLMKMMGRG